MAGEESGSIFTADPSTASRDRSALLGMTILLSVERMGGKEDCSQQLELLTDWAALDGRGH